MPRTTAEYVVIARDIAHAAVHVLRREAVHARRIRTEQDRDIKIEADFLLDAFVRRELTDRTGLPIVSEEQDGPRVPGAGLWWIVDPLDGSFNFSRGIPLCCVSIGLWADGEALAGVIHEAVGNDIFCGTVGEAVSLNDAPIGVSTVRELSRAVICTGFPTLSDHSRDAVSAFVSNVTAFKKVRLLGSAALSLAYVAAGRADAYAEDDIAIWDVAAGIALVRAAGGHVSMSPGSKPGLVRVRATNGLLPGSWSE